MPRYKGRRKGVPNVREKPEFEQQLVDLARVTRVVKGGKRLSFRACMVIGDRKGRVGVGVAKGADVQMAIGKAVKKANKALITVKTVDETIFHQIIEKYGAARILLKPASKGHGIVAGGVVRVILALSGIKNATGKILGSKSKINNARATINALKKLRGK